MEWKTSQRKYLGQAVIFPGMIKIGELQGEGLRQFFSKTIRAIDNQFLWTNYYASIQVHGKMSKQVH